MDMGGKERAPSSECREEGLSGREEEADLTSYTTFDTFPHLYCNSGRGFAVLWKSNPYWILMIEGGNLVSTR
ncbi:hypothetical protein NQZ68_014879 [Dissostichus eleginoides]|nr:hypothetical protein NQZ68_014879 [Dissostichus eleginoides]